MSLLNYNLDEIVNSDKFYDNLVKCGNLTMEGYESSMAVNGYKNKYVFTKPMKEERNRALLSNYSGLILEKKNFGLYLPKKAFRLIGVHFHPPENLAVPSKSDLMGCSELSSASIAYKDKFTFPKKIEIVGHKENDQTTLFIKQFVGFIEDVQEKVDYIEDRILEYFHENPINPKLKCCKDISKILNESNYYISEVFSFKNKFEYLKNLSKFKKFKITHDLFFENIDGKVKTDEEISKLSLEHWLDDIQNQQFSEEFGIGLEDDDFFVDSSKTDSLFY